MRRADSDSDAGSRSSTHSAIRRTATTDYYYYYWYDHPSIEGSSGSGEKAHTAQTTEQSTTRSRELRLRGGTGHSRTEQDAGRWRKRAEWQWMR